MTLFIGVLLRGVPFPAGACARPFLTRIVLQRIFPSFSRAGERLFAIEQGKVFKLRLRFNGGFSKAILRAGQILMDSRIPLAVAALSRPIALARQARAIGGTWPRLAR